ncbi:MAG: hypothetical protein ACRD0N_14265 [Acidimicrobiales bacterium]
MIARTATTVTTANGDGTETIRIYNQELNYQDDTGAFRPRDNSVVADAQGGYRRAAGPESVRFAANADSDVVTVADDGWSLGFAHGRRAAGPAGRRPAARRHPLQRRGRGR